MYVGKRTRTLKSRLGNYKNPDSSQKTNLRINGFIRDSLLSGKEVLIFEFSRDFDFNVGIFPVNISAGLEDSIIKIINPQWNILI